MRISQENVHSGRKKSHQSASPQGTHTSVCLSFPKALRLLKREQFKAVSKKRRRYFGKVLCIDWQFADSKKIGITTPRQSGKAIKRNFFKRRVREAFRRLQHEMPFVEMVIFPKMGTEHFTLERITLDFLEFYAQCRATKSGKHN